MNHVQAREEIERIKHMIEKTRKSHASSWPFLLLWGILVILGIVGMQVLVLLKAFHLIWLNWIGFMGIGVVVQIVLAMKCDRSQRVKTYVDDAVAHLGVASGVAFMFTGFLLPMLKVYPVGVIAIMVSVVAGIAVFTLGGIYELNSIRWCGVAWWLGALGMVFVHWHHRGLLMIPLVAVGYLLPAFLLHARYPGGGEAHDDR